MDSKFCPPFNVDTKTLTLHWSVPCQLVPHPLDELCLRILKEGKEGGRKEACSTRGEPSSDEDDEDDFFSKDFVVGRRPSSCEVSKPVSAALKGEELGEAMSEEKECVREKVLEESMSPTRKGAGEGEEDGDNIHEDPREEKDSCTLGEEDDQPLETLEDIKMFRLRKTRPKQADLGLDCYKDAKDISPGHLFGPTLPAVEKLLTVSKKSGEVVREALCLSTDEWMQITSGKDERLNLWGPTLAQVAMLSQRPLVRILRKEDPSERMGWGRKGTDGEWHITILTSVGVTSKLALQEAGSLEEAKQRLLQGWVQWKGRSLTEGQLEAFFRGESDEAEEMAELLLKLANATTSRLLFAMFTSY